MQVHPVVPQNMCRWSGNRHAGGTLHTLDTQSQAQPAQQMRASGCVRSNVCLGDMAQGRLRSHANLPPTKAENMCKRLQIPCCSQLH